MARRSSAANRRQTRATPLTLSDADRENKVVNKRLAAQKSLATVALAGVPEAIEGPDESAENETDGERTDSEKKGAPPKLASELAKQAWDLTTQGAGHRIVFCDARKDATAVASIFPM